MQLVLDPGNEVLLRVKGWGRDQGGIVTFAREEDPEPAWAPIGAGGRVRLRGLVAGVPYNVYLCEFVHDGPLPCLLLRGVKAGDAPREVVLSPGKEITGRATLPPGETRFNVAVLVGRTVLIDGGPSEDGTFRIGGVPEGRWTVVVYLTGADGTYHAATGSADAGGTVEIDARR